MSWFGMQSLRYLRLRNSVKMKRGAGLTLGPVTTISRHFAEQFCKIKIEKAHITL